MSALTLAEFAAAANATGADRDDRAFVPSTDSRTLRPGETFVCLRGPNYDGHDFIAAAIERGARAIVADNPDKIRGKLSVLALFVPDAKVAYMAGAAAARRRARCVVVGVTGSVGKTTTKSMCAQLIERRCRTLVTPNNENNELGVSKLCFALDESVEVAIAEMGARAPGQIAELVDIALPDVGVLTNVGEAHLEFFEDKAQLARTKFALFGKGAKPVLNAADEWSRMLAAEAGIEREALWVRLCGDPHCNGLSLEAGVPRSGRVAVTFGASHAFAPWHLVGEHHLRDALLAAGAAILSGGSFEEAIAGFGALHLPPGRFEIHRMPGGAIVVYDAYNASPTSVAHALRAFAEVPAARRIAVLGSMAELGPDASAAHEATGAAAARAGVDALYCGGTYAQAMADGARRAGMAVGAVATFGSNPEIANVLRETLGRGDAVLLKGSRVQKMEEILAALVAQRANAT
jgi:UDP-N-acetylmuramoyl-tripeptide--D-alanyl-D-alanine ligase